MLYYYQILNSDFLINLFSFKLTQVVWLILELIDLELHHWSELMQLRFLNEYCQIYTQIVVFYLKTEAYKLRSTRPMINQFQNETVKLLIERQQVDKNIESKIS